jgi:RHH-type transcriptional regulator, proline utilization regulon repressor / proline dehydrogenase / delta 1-pyrroline-5-carboxylate dehydrogenase
VHDALVARLAGAVEVLDVGQAERFATEVPPVIDEEAQTRVRRYADEAESQGTIAARAGGVPDAGWFCAPTVACGLPPDARVLREEVFGPLLTV